jgi:hypothetical protein
MSWDHWYQGTFFKDQIFLFILNYDFFLLSTKLFNESNNLEVHFSNLSSPFKLN